MILTNPELKQFFVENLYGEFTSAVDVEETQGYTVDYNGFKIVKMVHELIDELVNTTYSHWVMLHNSVTTLNVSVGGSIGSGGNILFSNMNIFYNRIFEFIFFDKMLKAIETRTNSAFDLYFDTYSFTALPMTGQEPGNSNVNGFLGAVGNGDESKINSLESDVKQDLIGYGFSNPLTLWISEFIKAFSLLIKEKFLKYKTQTQWKSGSIIVGSPGIANGGTLL